MANIEQYCKQGRIGIEDFAEFAARRAKKTNFLKVGDYVICNDACRKDILNLRKISRLDCPEKGDFTTFNGTTGPIRGNVFIGIRKGKAQKYFLIRGNAVNMDRDSAYNLVNKYSMDKYLQGRK